MEKYNLAKDMKLLAVKAKSFPNGVEAAFTELEKKIGSAEGRTFFGISHGGPDGVIYKAAALESFDGEAKKLDCESLVVKKGEYETETIKDWKKNKQKIGEAFTQLLKNPRLDMQSSCVEWYKGDEEVVCMVRMDPAKN